MNRFQRSWQLFKSSLVVMRRDPKLLLFPILTATFTFLVALLFLMPVAFQRTGHGFLTNEHWTAVGQSFFYTSDTTTPEAAPANPPHTSHRRHHSRSDSVSPKPLAIGYFALIYFTSMFCATFFNVAFYKQILNALSAQPVSILDGLRFAASKWKLILMWTLFAGAVGYLIKTLEERFGLVGQWIMKLLGTAWSVACVFVIPVIVTEETTCNPLTVLKKSALTLKRTWGEALIGYAGVSFGGFIILFLSLAWLAAAVAVAAALHLYWLTGVMVLSWLFSLILWSYTLSVASQIFRCALYVYAVQGTLPAPYTPELMAMAWRQKKTRNSMGI